MRARLRERGITTVSELMGLAHGELGPATGLSSHRLVALAARLELLARLRAAPPPAAPLLELHIEALTHGQRPAAVDEASWQQARRLVLPAVLVFRQSTHATLRLRQIIHHAPGETPRHSRAT